MQDQQLIKGLEEFFQSSHPLLSKAPPLSVVTSTTGITEVTNTSGSNGINILKLIAIGGLICLSGYFINKIFYQDDDNKPV